MLNPQVIFNTSCSSNMVSKVYPSNHSLFIFKHLLFYCMALLKTQLPSHTHALLHPRIFVCISTISRRSRIEMDHMLHIIGVASLFCCCLFICFSSLYFVVINKVLIFRQGDSQIFTCTFSYVVSQGLGTSYSLSKIFNDHLLFLINYLLTNICLYSGYYQVNLEVYLRYRRLSL